MYGNWRIILLILIEGGEKESTYTAVLQSKRLPGKEIKRLVKAKGSIGS